MPRRKSTTDLVRQREYYRLNKARLRELRRIRHARIRPCEKCGEEFSPDGKSGKQKYCLRCLPAVRAGLARYAHAANCGKRQSRRRVVRQSKKRRRHTKPPGWDDVVLLTHVEEGARLRILGDLWDKYGLDAHDWALLWERQNGRCPICEKPLTAKAHVDHDHAVGQGNRGAVRGLLHWQCNRHFVGSNTVATAKRMLSYLEGDTGI